MLQVGVMLPMYLTTFSLWVAAMSPNPAIAAQLFGFFFGFIITLYVCNASSRIGTRTTARGPFPAALPAEERHASAGIPRANVLPLPISAILMTSLPVSTGVRRPNAGLDRSRFFESGKGASEGIWIGQCVKGSDGE
jgi:hypothetical protein